MLTISILVVEDVEPERVYAPLVAALQNWLFVRKQIVQLREPEHMEDRWVSSLNEWPNRIRRSIGTTDLVFCTVDLAIPDRSNDGPPDAQNGIQIIHEIKDKYRQNVRCCVVTGLATAELDRYRGKLPDDLLFEFKQDINATADGSRNIVNYVKSQTLAELHDFKFTDSSGSTRIVLLDEPTGLLRKNYLSLAPYYVDSETWHVPTLIIGHHGFGRQTLLQFIAFLADAELVVVNLATMNQNVNHDNFVRLSGLVARFKAAEGTERTRCLIYVESLDGYSPDDCAEEGENCLTPLSEMLAILRRIGSRNTRAFPFSISFSVSGDSRLKIRSQRTRNFVRSLEETIGEMTALPFVHLEMDANGWTVDHPRIVRLPTLVECGKPFVKGVVDIYLGSLSETLHGHLGYKGQTITLAPDVLDFLCEKTDWSGYGNLGGLIPVLESAFNSFLHERSADQYQITRAHLAKDVYERFIKTVLNLDDVELELATAKGERLRIIDKADMGVQDGELLVILGPSGSGKSTILRIFAGLVQPTSGTAMYRGAPIKGPIDRIGFMFQDYALFPWLTVRQNLSFGPRIRGIRRDDYAPNVTHLLDVAELTGFANAYPHELSGGMRQRAAMMQSLANKPDVLLMDEPFGALDVQTRWDMQNFLRKTRRELGTTIVFVTHDIDEAVYVGDRIYIATNRPLTLAAEFLVPFATDDRNDDFRMDASFISFSNRVRRALLQATTAGKRRSTAEGPIRPKQPDTRH
jgi:ABC-type nitrate/sulfonate/bicarbonate transport system ATPase subunit